MAAPRARALPDGDRRRRPRAAAEARARARSRSSRSWSARTRSSIPTASSEQLVEFGYRREELVEHRGEFARRGAIVDVFPSTADAPIRIDLWGDEVDRLTTFGVNDQRSVGDLAEAMIFPARELTPSEDVRARAAALVASEPWGREQWERLAEGTHFEGMESWVPWLVDEPILITDVLPDTAKVVLIEPRRMRDRATELLAEEDDLAKALASTWARDPDKAFPRLHAEPAQLLAEAGAFWTIDSTPESPDTPVVQASGWGPIGGDGTGLVARLSELVAQGQTVTVAADGAGSATRLREILLEHGLAFRSSTTRPGSTAPAGGSSSPRSTAAARCRTRGWRSSPSPTSPAAGAPTARRDRAAARRVGVFEDLKPGNYVVHHMHGVGHYEGMVKRTIGGIERDYLLVAYKGGDKLYVPSDQIDTLRQYSGGEAPTLHRLGGSDFAKSKSRVRSAVREIAQELVVLYQKRVNAEGHAFPADTPWQYEMEDAFPYVETPDQRRGDRRRQARHGAAVPDGPARVRRRRVRQDRGRDPRRVQGDPGRQAGRRAGADDACSPASTATRSPTASPATRCGSRCCRAS